MDTMIEDMMSIKDDQSCTQDEMKDTMFGNKKSIVAGLSTIANLLLKLKKLKDIQDAEDAKNKATYKITKEDIKLMRNMYEYRQKHNYIRTTDSTPKPTPIETSHPTPLAEEAELQDYPMGN